MPAPGPSPGTPGPGAPPTDTDARATPLVDRIRGIANTVTLFGALAFLLGWTLGPRGLSPAVMAMIGLVTFGAFLVSVVTIVLGNRHDPTGHEEHERP